jgi:hypothetical protein
MGVTECDYTSSLSGGTELCKCSNGEFTGKYVLSEIVCKWDNTG